MSALPLPRGPLALCAALAFALATPSLRAQVPAPDSLALTGQPAPGFQPGALFSKLEGPRLDATGRSLFYGTATGGGVSSLTDQAIFRQSVGGLQIVAREGQLAPGTAGARFLNLAMGSTNPPALGLNGSGALAFTTRLIGGDVCDCNGNGVLDNDTALYREIDGSLHLLARADGQVPGQAAGLTFDTLIGQPALAEDGTLVFYAVFKGTGVTPFNGTAIMTAAEGDDLSLAVREGDPMPGFPAGTTLGFLGRPFVGPTGDFSFFTRLQGPDIVTTNDDVLLAFRDGAIELVAQQGEMLPNGDVLGNPSVLGAFFNHSLRGGDMIAFTSLLADGGSAVLREVDGELVEVARSGEQAPGLPLGTKFGNFGAFVENGPLQLGDDGRLVFMARLNTPSPSNETLWAADPDGTLHLLARGGDAPPDAPFGVTLSSGTGGFVQIFGSTALEPGGRVAFSAHLLGPGLDLFSTGLYATDATGTLRKVVQPGDVLDVAGDGSDLRTVLFVNFNKDASGLESYNGPVFSDDGVLVFRASFTDGSQAVLEADLDGAFASLGGGLAGVAGVPALAGSGTLVASTPGTIALAAAAATAPAALLLSLGSSPVPFKGGTLLAFPPLAQFGLVTNAAGAFTLPFTTPAKLPPALGLVFQVLVLDAAAVNGVSLSNGLAATTP